MGRKFGRPIRLRLRFFRLLFCFALLCYLFPPFHDPITLPLICFAFDLASHHLYVAPLHPHFVFALFPFGLSLDALPPYTCICCSAGLYLCFCNCITHSPIYHTMSACCLLHLCLSPCKRARPSRLLLQPIPQDRSQLSPVLLAALFREPVRPLDRRAPQLEPLGSRLDPLLQLGLLSFGAAGRVLVLGGKDEQDGCGSGEAAESGGEWARVVEGEVVVVATEEADQKGWRISQEAGRVVSVRVYGRG